MKIKQLNRVLFNVFIKSIFLLIMCMCFSCANNAVTKEKLSNKQIIENYYDARNNKDISKINALISDSLLWIDLNYTIARNKTEFYENFKWDSVFQSQHKIIDFDSISENVVEISFTKICKRIKFLHDSATVSRQTISIVDNKIAKINTTEYLVFDFEKWQSRRDSLNNWVKENHPELNGFVNDITNAGAQNYMKAIELYEQEAINLKQ